VTRRRKAGRAAALGAAVVAAGLCAGAAGAAVTMREVPDRAEAFVRSQSAPQQAPAAERRRPQRAAVGQPRAAVNDMAAPAFAAVSLTAFAAFFALGRRPG
jgi:hypothetical protein